MKSFSALSAAGRRAACPPAFLPSRGRRPAREIATRELRSEWSISKPGQALPPPPGTTRRQARKRGPRAVADSGDYSPARRSTSWMMRPQIALTQATAATPRTRERQGRISRKSSNP